MENNRGERAGEGGVSFGGEAARGEKVRRISGRDFFEKTGIDGRALGGFGEDVAEPEPETEPEKSEDERSPEERQRQMDWFYEYRDSVFGYVDKMEPVPFRALGDDLRTRDRQNKQRMARKLTVAILADDSRKLKASDYKLDGEEESLIAALAELDDEQIDFIGDSVLERIATPVRKKGAEAVYDDIREDEEATLRLYNLTEGWKKKDDESREISLEEQRKIGAEAVSEVLDKYPTALSFYREVENESRRQRELETDGATDERMAFEESAIRLGRMIYGAQFDYAEVFDDYIAGEVKFSRFLGEAPSIAVKPARLESAEPEVEAPRDEPETFEAPEAEAKPEPEAETPRGGLETPRVSEAEVGTIGGAENLGEIREGTFTGRTGRRIKYRDIRLPKPETEVKPKPVPGVPVFRKGSEFRVIGTSPDKKQAEEDARAVSEWIDKLEREKAEAAEAKVRQAEKTKEEEARRAAEEEAKAKRKEEVFEAREEAKRRFGVRLQRVPEPEETWKKVKANKAVFVSGGELVDIYGESEGRKAEAKPKRYEARDFEEFGLYPETVGSYIVEGKSRDGEEVRRTVIMSSPFRISGGDRGAGVLVWRQKEMTEKGKKKTGKVYKFFPEVYYKRDMDGDKRWLKVEGFAQSAQLGPGTVDYDFMEKEGEGFVRETSEGMSSVLDAYVGDADDYDYIGDKKSGDLILASATKQKAAVRADVGARSGVSRIFFD